MRNGLISVDAYKKSRAFYIYERKLRYCIGSFFPRAETREWKRFNGKGSMCFCASEVSARGNAGVSAAMESGTKLISFNRYLMLAKHFRWTVYMLKYDIMTHLNEFLMLFLVFELRHCPH